MTVRQFVPGSDPFDDPNHHLWRNGRFWWVAFTVHVPGYRKERIRESLGTTDLIEARHRRDALLAEVTLRPGVTLSLRPSNRPRVSSEVAA